MYFSRFAILSKAAVLATLFASTQLFAYGPHEGLDCLGCHDPHYAKAMKLFKVNNPSHPNPRTGKNVDGVSALCLGCHNLGETGSPIAYHSDTPLFIQKNLH